MTPHPRRDPRGHSYGRQEPRPVLLPPEQWHRSNDYLYGIDLYNYAYWWECHEVFEGLWHVAGQCTEQGNFFRAIIQLAAANLKVFAGNHPAARNLLHCGRDRLLNAPESYMGIHVTNLVEELRQRIIRSPQYAPSIQLDMPGRESREVRTRC
jgi:uncharacterized protein